MTGQQELFRQEQPIETAGRYQCVWADECAGARACFMGPAHDRYQSGVLRCHLFVRTDTGERPPEGRLVWDEPVQNGGVA